MEKDSVNPRWSHKTFAREYAQHGDRARAAKVAGSKANNLAAAGSQLLKNHHVQTLLLAIDNKADEKAVKSRAETISEVNSLIDEAIQAARAGIPIIAKNGCAAEGPHGEVLCRADIPGMLKGAELKGKTVAMFTDRQEFVGEMESKTDEELWSLVAAALTNHMILEAVAQHPDVVRKVNEFNRRDARLRESGAGDGSAEAESVSPAPEAGRVSQSRVH